MIDSPDMTEEDFRKQHGASKMNDWKEELTAIAKRCIETEKACRSHPVAYRAFIDTRSEQGQEYQKLSEAWQEAERDLWEITDVEYDDKDPLRAACWEWRFCKVMARKCCYLLRNYP